MSVALATQAGVAAAGVFSKDNAGLVVGAAALAAQYAIQLPNSRAAETEADEIGIQIAAKAGYPSVQVATADGWDGYPVRAPYDRILIAVGVHDLAPAWVEQLREGGLLVGAQVASGRVLRRSVTTASDSMNPCVISSVIAVTPERENFET